MPVKTCSVSQEQLSEDEKAKASLRSEVAAKQAELDSSRQNTCSLQSQTEDLSRQLTQQSEKHTSLLKTLEDTVASLKKNVQVCSF